MLDLGLPNRGYEVAKELRAKAEFAQRVIAAMMGYAPEADRQKTREAGLDHNR